MLRLKHVLLAATLIAGGAGGVAYAQMGAAFDPAQLPTVTGKVAQYLPTPRGDVDGLLLDDGTEVHFPPHLSAELVFAVKPGDSVTVHGLKARAEPLVDAASITNDATKVTVVNGGPWRHDEMTQMDAQGRIKADLHGPRGEFNGVVLDDGTVIHLPPPEATRLADQLAVGKTIVAKGEGFSGDLGKAIGARAIGPDSTHLVAIAGPHPGWEHWAHEHFGHGPHVPGMHPDMDGDAPPPPGAPPPAQ